MLLAPGYDAAALEVLRVKKNVRLLELRDWPAPTDQRSASEAESKPVIGGQLVQTHDVVTETREQMHVMSAQAAERAAVARTCCSPGRVCRHVRSNAIVLAAGGATIGIGAGQMSRVDAVRIAVEKAQASQPELLAGAALASDAYFPFADGPQLAIDAGVGAIIQPGGSVRDEEVVAAVGRGRRGDGRHRLPPLPTLSRDADAATIRRSRSAPSSRRGDLTFPCDDDIS